jgi:hypothetical protein
MNVGPSTRGLGAAAASLFLVFALASAQENPAPPQTPPPQKSITPDKPADKPTQTPDKGTPAEKKFKQEELDQLVAPIALYPDSLLSQVLMAATYPLEVVQAYRWQQANKALKDDALAKALEKQSWDPSVRSLVNFPQVLAMMNEKLDWMENLGDAFLAQQKEVMDTVQKLRAKAQAEGNLKTSKEQNVVVEPEGQTTVIKIESPDPQVIYVPTYNPTVVYGAWPYPSYPPYYYHPPGYVAGAALSFGLGVACGVAWGYAWGGCNWGHGDVDIDINRNTNINNNIDRGKYKQQMQNRAGSAQNRAGGQGGTAWQHDPSHRKGVSYRDQATSQKFGGSNSQAAKARESYRGRADAGASQLDRGGANPSRGNVGGATQRPSQPQAGTRNTGGSRNSSAGTLGGSRSSTGNRSSAFDGMDRSGASTRAMSSRGQSSRASAVRSSGGGGGRRGGGGGRRG